MISDRVDVLVVGGGPAGLYAARRLALDGFSVLVCEEHHAIGEPVHCTGVLSADTFGEFGVSREAILNPLSTVEFVSPGGIRVAYRTPTVQAVVIDRARFDRLLAADARAAGAHLRTSARVASLERTNDGIRARVDRTEITARLVLLACGAKYSLQRRFGLGLPSAYLHTAQRELPVERFGDVELHFGGEVAPAGFAWAVPVARPSGPHVRIGVMATRRAATWYASMIDRLRGSWGIAAPLVPPRQKILPLGPIRRTVDDRVLVVGDAAGIVKPTTGGGIYYSLMTASFAADVASRALKRDRLDAAALGPYERRWRQRLDAEIDSQSELRRIAERLTDREIDSLFELARTDGIMPIVRRTAQFNQHRHLIRALLHHPPSRKVLLRAVVG